MSGPSRLQNGVRKTNTSTLQNAARAAATRPSSRAGGGMTAQQISMANARMGGGQSGPVPPSPAGSTISLRSSTSRSRNINTSPTRKGTRREAQEAAAAALHEEQHNSETNINVVVRCRGRSEREIRESSVVVVSTPGGLRGREIALSMGPLALNNKTYSFDRVFGPEADQTMIYDDVVAPMLEEMLSGYNCTIFAYGQTGTGKTYTMTGDMADNFGSYSDTAGIIPRALYQLFNKLGTDDTDNSVKCSFIELYNEELRDLLAGDDNTKVKIFEDSTKKGAIVIQGMEESFIKSAEDGVKLLQEGSHKRQVAATKCNDLSSRSHTVFTITVHVKVMGDDGEDMLRTGKLNLVDLAGSENIGRSGAENKRAREAGMINQSLLTLGRVINALVDKSPHIPYRESKLTRLLQDSLGGRTKTCIIATISPAKSNLEETISTLDYAARAKDIRNKPQMNQMLTKKALIREYVLEIEKLKGDLQATRQKNGVFLTSESYQEMTEESESRRILNEEQQRKIEVMENSLKNTREQFENNMRMFVALRKDFEGTKTVLEETKGTLEKAEMDLSATQKSLADETVLRRAHESTEGELNTISHGLISKLGETVQDVTGLHGKIRRMTDLEVVNHTSWMRSSNQVTNITQLVENEIGIFTEEQHKLSDYVSERMTEFVEMEVKKLDAAYQHIESRLESFNDGEMELSGETMKAKDEMNQVLEEIKILREDVKDRVREGLKGLNDAAQRIAAEVVEDLGKFGIQLHASYSQLGKEFRLLFDEAQKSVIAQKAEVEKLRLQLTSTAAATTTAAETAQATLDIILKEERERAAADRVNLIAQITALINTTAEDQDKRLTQRVQLVASEMAVAKEELDIATKEYNEGMDLWTSEEDRFIETLTGKKEVLKTMLQEDWQNAEKQNASIQATTQAIHAQTVHLVDAQMQDIDVQMRALDEFVTRARSQNEVHYTQFVANLSGLTANIRDSYTHLENEVSAIKEEAEYFSEDMATQTSALKETIDPFTESTIAPLTELRRAVEAAPLKEYTPTGSTPRKREYEYPTTLPRTQSHEEILAQAHNPQHQRKHSRTPLGEKEVHSPNKTVNDTTHDTDYPQKTAPPSGPTTATASSIPGPPQQGTAGYSAYAHKIFFGTNIGGVIGPSGGLIAAGKFASDARGEVEAAETEEDEDDGQPPLKRTRSQSAKLGVTKGGYSAQTTRNSAPAGENVVIGKKRSR